MRAITEASNTEYRGPYTLSPSSRIAIANVLGAVMDCLIGLSIVSLTVIAFGGADFGIVSFHRAEKPVLALIALVPLRGVLGGHSWLVEACGWMVLRLRTGWTALSAYAPAAVTDTLYAVITVRIATALAGFVANLVFEPAIAHGFTMPFASAKFMEIFAAWDSGWYWDIAARGYYFRTDGQSSIAFFPLYPMLMRAAAAPFGGGPAATWIAGIVIANAANILALIQIHRFAEQLFGSRQIARRTVVYIAVFPWSFFMGRVYSESVFLLTTVLALRGAHGGRWWTAGAWGSLATLTRPNGILIALPLALFALQGVTSFRGLAARATALTPIPLAFLGFCLYVYVLTGDPLAWMAAQSHWGYSVGHPPWQQIQRVLATFIEHGAYDYFFTSDLAVFEMMQAVTALVFLMATPMVFRRLGAAMGVYVLVSLLVPLSGNTLEGLGRYTSVLFPVFLVTATMVTDRVHEIVVMASLIFRTMLVCLFVTWQPIY
jgi:hypothetical protein